MRLSDRVWRAPELETEPSVTTGVRRLVVDVEPDAVEQTRLARRRRQGEARRAAERQRRNQVAR